MRGETFKGLVQKTMEQTVGTLIKKQDEYANEDVFHNFVAAAMIQDTTKEVALGGMLAKHIVSIYDMIPDHKNYTVEKWQEKIGDAINYLLILSAMVKEECSSSEAASEEVTE